MAGSDISRRHVVGAAALIGAVSIVSCAPTRSSGRGAAGLRPGGAPVVRREIGTLVRDYPDAYETLKRAIAALIAPAGGGSGSQSNDWTGTAKYHEMFCARGSPEFVSQMHGSWRFLPWHRAFLLYTEKRLQAAAGDPTLALPYWDWTANREFPAGFIGPANPLNDPTRVRPFAAGDLVPWEEVDPNDALDARTFSQFGGRKSGNGSLEMGPHGNIHTWSAMHPDLEYRGNIGAFATAALDPLFFAHHGNLDRIWESWVKVEGRSNPEDAEFLDQIFLFEAPGTPMEAYRVGDLLDTQAVGYAYDSLEVSRSAASPGGFPVVAAPPQPSAAPALLDDVVALPSRSASPGGFGATAPHRIFLIIEGLENPAEPVKLRLFLTAPDSAKTVYSTTLSLLPTGAAGAPASRQDVYLDITDAVAALAVDESTLRARMELVAPRNAPPLKFRSLRIERDYER